MHKQIAQGLSSQFSYKPKSPKKLSTRQSNCFETETNRLPCQREKRLLPRGIKTPSLTIGLCVCEDAVINSKNKNYVNTSKSNVEISHHHLWLE